MSSIKLTKNELRSQQVRLAQFDRYLPTLQLKKAMLQAEVSLAEGELKQLFEEKQQLMSSLEEFGTFFVETVRWDLSSSAAISHVSKRYENIAGVEIPIFEEVVFQPADYFLFDTPIWLESAIEKTQALVILREKIAVVEEKKRALEKELKDVSIRVNLFEKILIPRAKGNISKIRIFLSDQQLSSVSQAKVAKKKIHERKHEAAL